MKKRHIIVGKELGVFMGILSGSSAVFGNADDVGIRSALAFDSRAMAIKLTGEILCNYDDEFDVIPISDDIPIEGQHIHVFELYKRGYGDGLKGVFDGIEPFSETLH